MGTGSLESIDCWYETSLVRLVQGIHWSQSFWKACCSPTHMQLWNPLSLATLIETPIHLTNHVVIQSACHVAASLGNAPYQTYCTLNWLSCGFHLHEVRNSPSIFCLPRQIRCYRSGRCDILSSSTSTTWWKPPGGDMNCINNLYSHWSQFCVSKNLYSQWAEIINKRVGCETLIMFFEPQNCLMNIYLTWFSVLSASRSALCLQTVCSCLVTS